MTVEERHIHAGADGRTDHRGEHLPVLSKRASILNLARVEKARRRSKVVGDHPGHPLVLKFSRRFFELGWVSALHRIEVTGKEHLEADRGTMTVAWHTNGFVDPMAIWMSQEKSLIFAGRHDTITRPVVGWWGSKLGNQPVIRQSEVLRGGATKEEAAEVNGRTMLTLAEVLAHGGGTAVFPEGTSNVKPYMVTLRSGSMRAAIAAASIAHEKSLPLPHILPVGLSWRTIWQFRTDAWVEYTAPISLEGRLHPPEERARLLEREWVEPPRDVVNALRDEVDARLRPLTPCAETWSEVRGHHVLGWCTALNQGQTPASWSAEVERAREARDAEHGALEETAQAVGDRLDAAGLDAREITATDGHLRARTGFERFAFLPLLVSTLALLPFWLPSVGPFAFFGWLMGERTDEGLDARVTLHMVACMFQTLFIWPFTIAGAAAAAWTWWSPLSAGIIALAGFPFLFLVHHVGLRLFDGWRAWNRGRRLARFARSSEAKAHARDVAELLVALK